MATTETTCTECKSSDLIGFTEEEEFTLNGPVILVPIEFNICQQCGAESILQEQIKKNDAQLKSCIELAESTSL